MIAQVNEEQSVMQTVEREQDLNIQKKKNNQTENPIKSIKAQQNEEKATRGGKRGTEKAVQVKERDWNHCPRVSISQHQSKRKKKKKVRMDAFHLVLSITRGR